MKTVKDNTVDLVLCDLPYGVTKNRWDTIIPFDELWEQYNRMIKENGAVVLFASQPFTTKLIGSNIKNFKYCWYWEKQFATGFPFSKKQPMRRIEEICVFYQKHPTYNPQGLVKLQKPSLQRARPSKLRSGFIGKGLANDFYQEWTNFPDNVLKFNKIKDKGRLHPTQKPVPLLEYLIRTYTNEGYTVLDNCMGSGSTAIACINTNRNFIGFELDPTYFNVARDRINKRLIYGE